MPRKPSRIRNAKDVYEAFKGMSRHREERLYAILLDGESVMGIEEISKGGDGNVDANPADVFSPALERHCRSLILVHNHPSGLAYPSEQDRDITRGLYRWGTDLGIELKDSVIIGKGGYYSFREADLLRTMKEEK